MLRVNLDKPFFKMFPKNAEYTRKNICWSCKKIVKESDFRTKIDKKEYTISGLCQSCQDDTFKHRGVE